jgi:hypothetical protein
MKFRSKSFFVALLLILTSGLGVAEPVHAIVSNTLVFQGIATVGNGFAYPCLSGKDSIPPNLPSIDVTKCTSKLGNSVPFIFSGSGVGIMGKVAKAKCGVNAVACAQVATYSVTAAGATSGWCGLSIGNGSATITPTATITETKSSGSPFSFVFSWTSIAGVAVVTGSGLRNGYIITIAGTSLMVLAPPHLEMKGTCLNKALKRVFIAGALTMVGPNITP